MALSMVLVSNYSVRQQFDNMPPEVRAQFNQGDPAGPSGSDGDAGRKLAQGVTRSFFVLVPPVQPGDPATAPERIRRRRA